LYKHIVIKTNKGEDFMWHTLHVEEVEENLKTNVYKGLEEEEVKVRMAKDGRNKLQEKKKENMIIKFLKQFNDFMIMILMRLWA